MDKILQRTKTILENLVFETYRARLIDVADNQKAYIDHFKDMAYDLYSIHEYQSFSSIMIDIENGLWNHVGLDHIDAVCIAEYVFTPLSKEYN